MANCINGPINSFKQELVQLAAESLDGKDSPSLLEEVARIGTIAASILVFVSGASLALLPIEFSACFLSVPTCFLLMTSFGLLWLLSYQLRLVSYDPRGDAEELQQGVEKIQQNIGGVTSRAESLIGAIEKSKMDIECVVSGAIAPLSEPAVCVREECIKQFKCQQRIDELIGSPSNNKPGAERARVKTNHTVVAPKNASGKASRSAQALVWFVEAIPKALVQ